MPVISKLLAVAFLAGVAMAQDGDCNCYKDQNCADVAWAKFQPETGVYWTWASPCAGACSTLPNPLPYGWRYATDAEWALRPMQTAFFGIPDDPRRGQIYDQNVCSAFIFDPRWNHCDHGDFLGGYVTSQPRNTNWETLLVHDCPDPIIETTPSPTCKDPCTVELCEGAAASGQRECVADGIEVDPFDCGGHRCSKVKCTDCGTVDDCIAKCQDYKVRKGIKGPPSCRTECEAVAAAAGQSDFICLQRCQFGDVPICREMCSKSFCASKGDDQLCSAQDMLVDPKNEADDCGTSQCSHCGAQGKCVALCEEYNLEEGASIKCAQECQKVAGYKCFNKYTD